MRGYRILCLILGAQALFSCGKISDLHPATGERLPQKALMARTTPTAEDLLTPPPIGSPQRVDELMKRSAPRRGDPFDLPPPGGEAPTVPIQEQPDTANQAGPVTPQ
jgi:hypothetical protein